MKCKVNLLVRPQEKNANGIIYDEESYIKALKFYIKNIGALYIKDEVFYTTHSKNISEMYNGKLELMVGNTILIDENNWTVEVDLNKDYYNKIKNNLNEYFIMCRLMAKIVDNKYIIKRISLLEIDNAIKDYR